MPGKSPVHHPVHHSVNLRADFGHVTRPSKTRPYNATATAEPTALGSQRPAPQPWRSHGRPADRTTEGLEKEVQ
ncbi:hypothetical protein BPORC_1905 [Bifidobacterium porcinum]|nr:hypothetical protein BPORC_1905 [Bifidobacterium porcinum]